MANPPSAVIHDWLSYCRKQCPELPEAEFQKLVPKLIALRRKMLQSNRRGTAS